MTDFTFEDYKKNKFQYQEDGENLLLEKKHACLFYEPGKGKTYPAIAALLQVAPRGKVLIMSTADSIKNMWQVDIVPQHILPENTVLMTFNSAIQDETKRKLLSIKWDVIIVDECHKVKSHNSQISKLVFQLTKSCKYVWGLTGTPRGNVDLDIYCQFHNLNIGEWGLITYTNFVNTCCDVDKKWGQHGMYTNVLGINHRYLAGWERNVAMYTQRVAYEDGDMPPLNIRKQYLPFEESEQYKKVKDGIFAIDDDATTLAKLAVIQKLHQAANGFLYYNDDDDVKNVYRFEHNKKIDWLKDNIKVGEKVTIVYRHKADLTLLEETFGSICTESIADYKAGKYNVLLLQCSRCESFNLQMCSRMIFFTMDYSFIKFKQMLHRIWRQGQENETIIEVLVFKNSIEEQIYAAVMGKKNCHDLFMSIKGA